jgi:hypothetical protein
MVKNPQSGDRRDEEGSYLPESTFPNDFDSNEIG